MKTDFRAVAEAFSSHRFAEAFEKLADDVRWEVDREFRHGRPRRHRRRFESRRW